MARNCHKSAYHAAYLRHLQMEFLYPGILSEYGITDAVSALEVGEALERTPDIDAVLIVSPTYEGRIADVAAIAGVAHEKGIPLIVDEAHGAHLGLAEGFPQNSCQAGADLVIHSVHKTLPALTQAGLLHVNGRLIDRDKLRRFLRIYQTSSPSYPLMASIDNALQYTEKHGREAFSEFLHEYKKMTERLSACRYLKVLTGKEEEQDTGKLVVSVRGTVLTGKALYEILLNDYKLQMEMASTDFVLAMFTVNDGSEAYNHMTEALLEIDRKLWEKGDLAGAGREPSGEGSTLKAGGEPSGEGSVLKSGGESAGEGSVLKAGGELAGEERISGAGGELEEESPAERRERPPEKILLAEAWEMSSEEVKLKESAGRYVAEFINLYPPGIPVLIPGELMTEALCREIELAAAQGLNVQGICKRKDKDGISPEIRIKVLTKTGSADK